MSSPVNKRVRLNISGRVYETYLETLNRYPCTLLGNALRRTEYFNAKDNVYFLDRSPVAFDAILFFYQSNGCLIRPNFMRMELFEEECIFYDLGEQVIKSMKEREGYDCCESIPKPIEAKTKLQKVWRFFEEPESSLPAKIFGAFSLILIIFVIGIDCFATLKTYQIPNIFILSVINLSSNIFFALEFIARLICTPSKSKFVKSIGNMLDFFAIFPSFPLIFFEGKYVDGLIFGRIFRTFRILRLMRTSKNFKSISVTFEILSECIGDVITLLFCILITCTLCGNLIYFAELDNKNSTVVSAPEGMWLVLQTIATLGYGDVVPVTILGKILTAFTAAVGVVMAFPFLSFGGKYFHAYAKIYKVTMVDY